MKEEEIKKLLKNSVIRTSDTFTDELMHKVDIQKAERKAKYHFFTAIIACVFLCLAIYRFSVEISLLKLHITISALFIRVAGSLFIFIVLHRLLMLRNLQPGKR